MLSQHFADGGWFRHPAASASTPLAPHRDLIAIALIEIRAPGWPRLLGRRLPVCAGPDCGCAAKGAQDISGVLLPEGLEVGAITLSGLGMEGDVDVSRALMEGRSLCCGQQAVREPRLQQHLPAWTAGRRTGMGTAPNPWLPHCYSMGCRSLSPSFRSCQCYH